jgi:hypothetical protein
MSVRPLRGRSRELTTTRHFPWTHVNSDAATWVWLFALIAVLVWGILLILGRGLTFMEDEWFFIADRSLDPASWSVPFNEHWCAVPIVAYQILLHTIGLASYLPYLGLLLVAHVLVAAAVFSLVATVRGRGLAFLAGCLVLVFGNGFENLFWAFQLGYVISIAAGLWALVVLRGPANWRRGTLAACLLLVAVASGPGGPVLLSAAFVAAAIDPKRRRYLPALVIPLSAYAGWYLIYRPVVAPYLGPGAFTLQSLADYPPILLWGIASSVGAVFGLGPVVGACATVVIGWISLRYRRYTRQRDIGLAAGMACAVALEMYLIAAARGNLGPAVVASPRYLYLAVPVILVGASAWLGPASIPGSARNWRKIVVLGIAAYAVALASNVAQLAHGREPFAHESDLTRAMVTVIKTTPTDRLRLDVSLGSMPTVGEIRLAVQHFGWPDHDWLGPADPVPQDLLDRVRAAITYPIIDAGN